MKTSPALLLALLGSIAFAQGQPKAAAPETATVAALAGSPAKWDGKTVVVTGTVADFEARVSKKGNKYTVFKLTEGTAKVSVWLRDHLPAGKAPANGGKAAVTGIFRKEKKVGQISFKNEIDASLKAGKPYGVKVLAKGS